MWAVAAGALPVIFHLIRKMRARKVKFSSLLFLRATPKELIKKRRLRDLILLIVRSIIFALLAFAFARPFIPQDRIPFITRDESKSVVLLIDVSYSMQYEGVFERVREKALDLLDDAGPADEYSLVFFSDEAAQITSLDIDMTVHKNAIDNKLEPGFRPTEFYKPLKLAEEILDDAVNPDKRIIMISDFQNLGWSNQFESWKMNPNITFVPEKIAPDKIDNSFVNNFNLKKRRAGDLNAAEYKVGINAEDKTSGVNETAGLWINGRLIENRTIDKGQLNLAFFQQIGIEEGKYQGYVKSGNDGLSADDAFYFSYSVEKLPSILCVDGTQSGIQKNAFYLEKVFDLGSASLFDYDSQGKNYLTRARLRDYQLVFVTNIDRLSDNQFTALTRYVSDGGSLVITFGNRVNINRMSAHLNKFKIGTIQTPGNREETRLREAIIGEVDLKHPIFSLFVSAGAGELFRPKFRRYVKVLPDSSAAIIGSYDTGDPFLIESRIGAGKVFAYTSSLNTEWSDFSIHEIFVPFLYQLATYAVSKDTDKNSYLVGSAVPMKGAPGDEWEVSAPGDRIFKIQVDETGTAYFRNTDVPGNYTAEFGDNRFNFSVNVDVKESDLRTRDSEEALAVVSKSVEGTDREAAAAMSGDITKDEKSQKLWRYIMFLVMGLFAFESYFANKKYNLKPEETDN